MSEISYYCINLFRRCEVFTNSEISRETAKSVRKSLGYER